MNGPDPSIRRVRMATVLALVGVFVAGGLTGAGIHRWLTATGAVVPTVAAPRPLGPPELAELGLSAEQERQARAIGEDHRPELEALRQEMMPRVLAIHERMQRELREFLTPAQREQLDRLIARRRGVPPADPFAPPGPPGPPSAPPPEAVAACSGVAVQAPCRFAGPNGTVEGSCREVPQPPGVVACVPAGGPPPSFAPPPPPGP